MNDFVLHLLKAPVTFTNCAGKIHTKPNHACIPEEKVVKEQTSDWHITTKDKPVKCMVNLMVFKFMLQPNGI